MPEGEPIRGDGQQPPRGGPRPIGGGPILGQPPSRPVQPPSGSEEVSTMARPLGRVWQGGVPGTPCNTINPTTGLICFGVWDTTGMFCDTSEDPNCGDSGGGGGTGGGGGAGGGGGCGCGTGGGTGGGGGGGGPGGPYDGSPNCSANPCRNHDGIVVDKGSNVALISDPDGTYCGRFYDDLPFCDDVPCPPPAPNPVQQNCDNCIKGSLDAINETLKHLGSSAYDCMSAIDAMTDECIQSLAAKLKGKILPPARSCEECKKRVEIGLATAYECAATFANCVILDCESSCSGKPDDACCKDCGQSECVCKNEECIPKPATADWWSTVSCDGSSVDAQQGSKPDSNQFDYIGGPFSDKNAALDDANGWYEQHCQTTPTHPTPPTGPTGSTNVLTAACELNHYKTRIAAQNYLQTLDPPIVTASTLTGFATGVTNVTADLGLVGAAGQIAGSVFGSIIRNTAGTDLAADLVSSVVGCTPTGIAQYMKCMQVLGMAGNISGVDVTALTLPLQYALNAACRPQIMSTGQAMAGYLSNHLNKEQLDTFYAAAGFCEGTSDTDVQASRAKPNPADLVKLRRRKVITEEEYNDGMRQLGYIDQQDVDRLFGITEQVPGMSDIIRFMTRDADDKAVVDKFSLDDHFDDKYNKQLREWGESQGVPEVVAKYNWRAHWQIPSPSQLYTMFQRLRGPEVPDNVRVTEEDIKAALEQQDIPPYWIDKFMALVYPPLGRIDIRRAFEQGSMTDDQCKAALRQLGYSDENVDILFQFMLRLKTKSLRRHPAIANWIKGEISREEAADEMTADGFTTEQVSDTLDTAAIAFIGSDFSKAFIRGELSRDAFVQELRSNGVDEGSISSILYELSFLIKDTATIHQYTSGLMTQSAALSRMTDNGMAEAVAMSALDNADDEIAKSAATRCQNAVKRRYLTGDIGRADAKAQLLSYGIVETAADKMTGYWQCELKTKDKNIAASVLCGWLAKGAISSDDFMRRMLNVGYSQTDAELLLSDCTDRIATNQAKAEAKRTTERERNESKAAARAAKAESRASKIARQLDKARSEKIRLRKQRQTQILTASKNVLKKCLCTDIQSVSAVVDQHDRLQQAGLSLDESLRVVLQASEGMTAGSTLARFVDLVDAMSSAVSATEAESTSVEESTI